MRDVAFRATKDLVRGATTAELSNSERSALRVIGVDPGRHATWPLHTAGCDGDGGSCHQRAAELAAQRFERGEADRHARRASPPPRQLRSRPARWRSVTMCASMTGVGRAGLPPSTDPRWLCGSSAHPPRGTRRWTNGCTRNTSRSSQTARCLSGWAGVCGSATGVVGSVMVSSPKSMGRYSEPTIPWRQAPRAPCGSMISGSPQGARHDRL